MLKNKMPKTSWYLGKQRLIKLARHLISNKLSVDMFDFGVIRLSYTSSEENKCGTCGCALGECPAVFPNYFRVSLRVWNRVIFKAKPRGSLFKGAEIFFGISHEESDVLFDPRSYYTNVSLDQFAQLSDCATAPQVGKNILKFIKWKDQQLDKSKNKKK